MGVNQPCRNNSAPSPLTSPSTNPHPSFSCRTPLPHEILTKRLLMSLPSQTPLADSSPANPSSRSPAGAWQPRIARNALPSVPSFREGVGFEGKEGVGDGLTKRSGRRRSGGISPHEPEKKKRSPGTGSANPMVLFPPLAFPTRGVV
jgi:hypothetical protein